MAVNAGSRATMQSVGLHYIRSYDEDDGEAVEYGISRAEWIALK
jgi:hypothetical protein